jgi:MSHA biogenesis protein MshO
MRSPARCQQGFTLVEVILSIVIIGILGIGVANFMHRTVQGYQDTAERQQLAKIGWVVSEKVSRELRDALPNSIRLSVSDTCIEFIPVLAGTDYLSVPVVSAGSSFEVVPFSRYSDADVSPNQDRVAVYPYTVSSLYSLGNPGTISGLIASMADGATANSKAITLAASHRFPADSPTHRLFIVRTPAMFCFDSGFLYRYDGYGYSFSAATANRVVVGHRLSNGSFGYAPGTESRNGLVAIRFDISAAGSAVQSINQEVQIRNVP